MSHTGAGPNRLLILGHGEIARCLARLADTAGYPVTVCDHGAEAFDWPGTVELIDKVYTDAAWPLANGTHAVIARGHNQDPLSVAMLLTQGAERVYLIASARRASAVIHEASAALDDPALLDRLSAPAGLALGGRDSMQIALSILAEIQWRAEGGAGSGRPLSELREQCAGQQGDAPASAPCPGQRP